MRVPLVLLTLLLATGQGRAQTSAGDVPARLSVQAGAGAELCPNEGEVARRVEAILHRPLRQEVTASELAIDVRFERATDGTLQARVAARGSKSGQRLLRDTDATCSALGEAVSVAIALLLDSALNEAVDAGTRSQPEPASSPPALPPADTAGSASASSRAPVWAARAALEVGGAYGLAGSGSLLGFGRLGARYGGWLLDLGAGGTLPSERSFDGGRVRTSLLFASVRACYLLGRALPLGPCLQAGAGRLHGVGSGYGQGLASSLVWTAGGLGLAAETALGSGFWATFGASLWVPTRRQTFSVENAGIAWESKPMAGTLTAGLALQRF